MKISQIEALSTELTTRIFSTEQSNKGYWCTVHFVGDMKKEILIVFNTPSIKRDHEFEQIKQVSMPKIT